MHGREEMSCGGKIPVHGLTRSRHKIAVTINSCDVCGEHFCRKDSLQRHRQWTHEEVRDKL